MGVFAAHDVAPGESVLVIDDSFTVDAAHPVPAGEEVHCDYLEAGRTVWMQKPERFINHCCRPNVFVETRGDLRHVVALRPIVAGEEITYDYCINGYGDTVWTCECGNPQCRRTMHSDFFHLPLDVQREYPPLLDEWFRREWAGDVRKLQEWLAGRHP